MILDIRGFVPLNEAESFLFCLNQNSWLLVQMLHSFYGSWRNRYTQNSEVRTPIQPDDTQFRAILDTFNQGERELSEVTCLSDLIDAITAQTEAITNQTGVLSDLVQATINGLTALASSSGCGGCSGGTGTVLPLTPVTGQPGTGGGPGGGGLPPGYSGTLDSYSAFKCNAANYVFDSISLSIRTIGGLAGTAAGVGAGEVFGSWLLTTLTALAATYAGVEAEAVFIFLFLTGWEIALVIAAIAAVTVIAGSAFIGTFVALADEFDSRKDTDIICELYNAQSIEDARSALSAVLSDSIAAFVISPPFDAFDTDIRSMLSTIIGYFIPDGLLNALFSNADTFAALTDYVSDNPIDCDCGGTLEYSCVTGTVSSSGENFVEVTALGPLGDGSYLAAIGFPIFGFITPSIVVGSLSTPSAVPAFVWALKFPHNDAFCGAGSGEDWTETYDHFIDDTREANVTMQLRSDTPFVIRFDFS